MAAGTDRFDVNMVLNNPYQKYKDVQVASIPKEDVVVLAYEGAIKFINKSIECLEADDLQKAHFNCIRSQEIINELVRSLNFEQGGEIAHNLLRLYEFMVYRLMIGNSKKISGPLVEVRDMLETLRQAWVGIKESLIKK